MAKSNSNKETLKQVAILLGMAVLIYFMYNLITSYNVMDLIEIPTLSLTTIIGLAGGLTAFFLMYGFTNRQGLDKKVSLIMGIIIGILTFYTIYHYLKLGITTVIIMVIILAILFFTGGLKRIMSGVYDLGIGK